jgi:hypothetical protein
VRRWVALSPGSSYGRDVEESVPHLVWPTPQPVSGDLMIVPLTRRIADLDFVAYQSSPRAISTHSADRWPIEGFTREENCRLIAIHETEHAAGEAYAYAILSSDGMRELGCVYLRQLSPYLERTQTRLSLEALDPNRTAIATFWLIDDQAARPAASHVLRRLRQWIQQWGAVNVVFRCLPDETESVEALTACRGLRPIRASDQELPYLWFADKEGPGFVADRPDDPHDSP